jgi:hypothetical protein
LLYRFIINISTDQDWKGKERRRWMEKKDCEGVRRMEGEGEEILDGEKRS